MTDKQKITSYPLNWPMDKQSRGRWMDDKFVLSHPNRTPHQYDPETRKWSEMAAA